MASSLKTTILVNRLACGLGFAVFLAAFLFVDRNPEGFEAAVKRFVVAQVEDKVREKVSADRLDRFGAAAGMLSQRMKAQVEEVQAQLDAQIPELVGAFVAAMCNVDCDRKAELQADMRALWQARLERLQLGFDRTKALVERQYEAVLEDVRADLRIFLLSNLLVMGLALALALFKGRAGRHLLPMSLLLFVSTLAGASWYVLGQDWLLTILYQDYAGWSYLAGLGLLTLFLLDIALNSACVTTKVLNGIGSVFSAVPLPTC